MAWKSPVECELELLWSFLLAAGRRWAPTWNIQQFTPIKKNCQRRNENEVKGIYFTPLGTLYRIDKIIRLFGYFKTRIMILVHDWIAVIYVAYYHPILVLKHICTESRACVFENSLRHLRILYAKLFYWKSFDFACPTRPIHKIPANILSINTDKLQYICTRSIE